MTHDGELTSADQAQAAHHEAGHAVAAAAVGFTVTSVAMRDNSWARYEHVEWTGVTTTADTDTDVDDQRTVVVTLAGGAGEALHDGTPEVFPIGCDEWAEAQETLADRVGGPAAAELFAKCWITAREIIATNRGAWTAIAGALLVAPGHRLDREQCQELLSPVHAPPWPTRRP